MKYSEFENLISYPRLKRYARACNNNKRKARCLCRANIRMSQGFLGSIGNFEIILRNKIDAHYKTQFANTPDWLLASTQPGGFLTQKGCQNSLSKITKAYTNLGKNHTHDKLLASLSFGCWKFLFAGKQFQAGGNTLLRIFPKLPAGKNQKFIFNKLNKINTLRNRVAHHEPICFSTTNTINTAFAKSNFQEIPDLCSYMDVNPDQLLCGTNEILQEANYIENI